MRKPRADAVLQNLPADRQEQVIAWLREGGLAKAREQLAADGVAVSESMLSRFWQYWQLRDRHSAMRHKRRGIEQKETKGSKWEEGRKWLNFDALDFGAEGV